MSELATETHNDEPASTELLDAIDGLIDNPGQDTPEVIEGQEEAVRPAEDDIEASDDSDSDDDTGEDLDVAIDTDAEENETIDYELEIPLGDGLEPVKLGAMKDVYQNLERERSAVDKQRMSLINQEQELDQFMQSSGIEIPRGFQEHMQRQQETYLQGQHELMMQMVPEAQDKESFAKMRAGIEEVALASNFTVEEISKFSDARVIHAFNRLAVFEAKQKNAQETVVQLKSKSKLKGVKPKPRTKQSKIDKQFNDALKGNSDDAKLAAIDAMLG